MQVYRLHVKKSMIVKIRDQNNVYLVFYLK
jgi:hypothetical protein